MNITRNVTRQVDRAVRLYDERHGGEFDMPRATDQDKLFTRWERIDRKRVKTNNRFAAFERTKKTLTKALIFLGVNSVIALSVSLFAIIRALTGNGALILALALLGFFVLPLLIGKIILFLYIRISTELYHRKLEREREQNVKEALQVRTQITTALARSGITEPIINMLLTQGEGDCLLLPSATKEPHTVKGTWKELSSKTQGP